MGNNFFLISRAIDDDTRLDIKAKVLYEFSFNKTNFDVINVNLLAKSCRKAVAKPITVIKQ